MTTGKPCTARMSFTFAATASENARMLWPFRMRVPFWASNW